MRNMRNMVFSITVLGFFSMSHLLAFADQDIAKKRTMTKESIFSLHISYVHLGNSKYAPAYYDGTSRTVYVWRGISLSVDNTPDVGKISCRTTVFDIDRDKEHLTIEYIFPEVKYMIKNRKIYLGYYDWGRQIFYKWKYVSFDEGAIPKRFKEKIYTEHPEVYGIHKEVEIDIPDYFWDSIFSK